MFRRNKNPMAPKFSNGDIVRVCSKERISQSLDSLNRLEGCLMMGEMYNYCGQSCKVLKAVKNFFDERQYKMYKARSPLYILEGVICNGRDETLEQRCDRSCFFLWHEKWLEGVEVRG
jgi:hypothetical protein